MIMHLRRPLPYSHPVSEPFLAAIKTALATHTCLHAVTSFMAKPLELEFPEDIAMRRFARKHLHQIAKLAQAGHKEIWITRTLSHGLEICV